MSDAVHSVAIFFFSLSLFLLREPVSTQTNIWACRATHTGFDDNGDSNVNSASPDTENEDAPEYWQFLHGLHNDGSNLDFSDDADDGEYDFLKDEAIAQADEPIDEFRTDKAVRITKDELKFIQETTKDLEREDSYPHLSAHLQSPAHSKSAKRANSTKQAGDSAEENKKLKKLAKLEKAKRNKLQKFVIFADKFKPAVSAAPFKAPKTRDTLQRQLCQHLQLLVQQLILVSKKGDSDSKAMVPKIEEMIKQVETRVHQAAPMFNIDSMRVLLHTVSCIRPTRRTQHSDVPLPLQLSLVDLDFKKLTALVHGEKANLFFQPELVPKGVYKDNKMKLKRLRWLSAEDRLLAIGVVMMRGNFEEIKLKYFGNNKTVKQMLTRFQNSAQADRRKVRVLQPHSLLLCAGFSLN